MNFIDFKTAYARLGNHPGDMGPDEARLIFDSAMAVRHGGKFLEIGPGSGRTTVIIGIAAQNVGAQIVVAADARWSKDQNMHLLFNRATSLHGFTVAIYDTPPLDEYDFVLITGQYDADVLRIKEGGIIIQRMSPLGVKGAQCLNDQRPRFSIWKILPPVEAAKLNGGIIELPILGGEPEKPDREIAVEKGSEQ